jgi:replicative DNA helicase
MSGSGKSTIVRQWLKEMIELNPKEKFDVLSFQFEMLGLDEVARDVSSKLDKSIKELYSAEGNLSDNDMARVNQTLDALKNYPIFVVDNIGTVDDIRDTILFYATSNKLAERKRGLVVTIDHSLLVRMRDGDDEKQTLDRLMHTLVFLKKYLSTIGIKTIFIVLSQLNRNIETNDRITNPKLHYPNKNDLFGASSVYYSSDYVLILHRPCLVEGLGNWYGVAKRNYPDGLPVFNPKNPRQPMIYLHVIKERFGHNRIIPMLDDLGNGKITETDL